MAMNVSILLGGLWLFLSAFLWPHSTPQFLNAVICGVLVVSIELLALGDRRGVRYVNIIVGCWLLLSTLVLPWTRIGTAWNHLAVGVAVILLSLRLSGSSRADGSLRSVRTSV
jgi:hypothetical protein